MSCHTKSRKLIFKPKIEQKNVNVIFCKGAGFTRRTKYFRISGVKIILKSNLFYKNTQLKST